MTATELRRRARAARTIDRYPTAADRLEQRRTAALGALAAALGPEPMTTAPGYRVIRAPDGSIAVERQDPAHVDQLALWRIPA